MLILQAPKKNNVMIFQRHGHAAADTMITDISARNCRTKCPQNSVHTHKRVNRLFYCNQQMLSARNSSWTWSGPTVISTGAVCSPRTWDPPRYSASCEWKAGGPDNGRDLEAREADERQPLESTILPGNLQEFAEIGQVQSKMVPVGFLRQNKKPAVCLLLDESVCCFLSCGVRLFAD